MTFSHHVEIDYTNHRGERRRRVIHPIEKSLRFTSTPDHPVAQWVFDAIDVERGLHRTFALANVHEWKVVPP